MARFGFLGPVRDTFRRRVYDLFESFVQTDDGRRILSNAFAQTHPPPRVPAALWNERPYADIGLAASPVLTPPVFVTARFRSGSTLVWNLFRHVSGCTAYYEPLNERRWFDPDARGSRVDATHRGVDDYWREYENLADLDRWFDPHWYDRRLYMTDSEADPALEQYIRRLIDAAPGVAVLQFNRVDFRLPWLRARFPDARLLHVYRHPRDQWMSTLGASTGVPRDITMRAFEPLDHFYLLAWARDLCRHFPALDPAHAEHAYDLFYGIWRLSYLFGRRYADASFAYEALVLDADVQLPRLMTAAGIERYDSDALKQLLGPLPPARWLQADAAWFGDREQRVDELLRRQLGEWPA